MYLWELGGVLVGNKSQVKKTISGHKMMMT